MIRSIAAIFLACFLAACGTPVRHQTASGKPEVTLPNGNVDMIKSEIINRMINAGYRVTKDTSYELSFDKPVENVMAAALLGSKYDSQPNARVTYTIAKMEPSVRVVADMAIITNPGSSFERRTPMNNAQDSTQVQTLLDSLKYFSDPSAAGSVARRNGIVMGLSTISPEAARKAGRKASDSGQYIAIVAPGSVAERAGVKQGDMLVSYAGKPIRSQDDVVNATSHTKPGATVPIEIERAGEIQKVSLTFPKPTSQR